MSSGADTVSKLPPSSEEFKRVYYLLQLSLRGIKVDDVTVWRVQNPNLNVQFERHSRGLRTVDCWVNVASLDAENDLKDVCARGFRAPESGEGLRFVTGEISVRGASTNRHQFVLCRVAVGRAYALVEGSREDGLPRGYDSLYVHSEEGEDGEEGGREPGQHYEHSYVVFNPAQARPEYVVHFAFNPEDAVAAGAVVPAPIPLKQLREVFRTKVSEVKSKVSRALDVLGPSLGDETEAMLSRLSEEYESALHASAQPDPLLEDRKRTVNDALGRLESKLKAVQENTEACYQEIWERYEAALQRLEGLTRAKTAALMSEELELRRQLDQLAWAEAFVPTLQELRPTAFVEAWRLHEEMRRELIASAEAAAAAFSAAEDVQADIRVVGEVDVMAGGGGSFDAAAGGRAAGLAAAALTDKPYEGTPMKSTSNAPPQQESNNLAASWARVLDHEAQTAASAAAATTTAAATNPAASASASESKPPPPRRMDDLSRSLQRPSASSGLGDYDDDSAPTPDQARAMLQLENANLARVRKQVDMLPAADRAAAALTLRRQEDKVREAEKVYSEAIRSATVRDLAAERESSQKRQADLDAVRHQKTLESEAESKDPDSASSSMLPSRQAPGKPSDLVTRAVERHSMNREAERRAPVFGLDDEEIAALAFPRSDVLAPDQARLLYLNLPLITNETNEYDEMGNIVTVRAGAPVPFHCRRIFSMRLSHPATVAGIADAYTRQGGEGSTVVVGRTADGHVLGGYASNPWYFNGDFYGSPASFLFTLTRGDGGVKIPFVGRSRGPVQESDRYRREEHERAHEERMRQWEEHMANTRAQLEAYGVLFAADGSVVENPHDVDTSPINIPAPRKRPFVRHDAQRADMDVLQFGHTDLVFRADFSECESDLEHSYGVGLPPGSAEARTFLAGAPRFALTELEVWAVGEAAIDENGNPVPPPPDGAGFDDEEDMMPPPEYEQGPPHDEDDEMMPPPPPQ